MAKSSTEASIIPDPLNVPRGPNQTLETNCRPATPLDAGRQFGRATRARPCLSGDACAFRSVHKLAFPSGWTEAAICAYVQATNMRIELDREEDGRWLTEIPELPGVMAYGQTREEALARVKALALRVMADRLEHGEAIPELVDVFSVAA